MWRLLDDLIESTQLPLSADAAVTFALQAFPDMKAAELQVTDAYLGLDLAKAQRMPRITGSYSVGSGYSQNRQTLVTDPVTQDVTIETVDEDIVLTTSIVDPRWGVRNHVVPRPVFQQP